MHYKEQLAQKRLILEDTLRRIGKISDVTIAPVIPSPRPLGYRQVLRMGIGQGRDGMFLGFFESGTQELLPVDTCFLVDEDLRSVLDGVRGDFVLWTLKGRYLKVWKFDGLSLKRDVC